MRLRKQCDLDILHVCLYVARYSVYNPTEHLWSPMSKKLNSVRLSAVVEGDDKPPCNVAGITSEEVRSKELEVFDKTIADLCHLWTGTVFDRNEILPVYIPAGEENDKEHDRVLKAPM